MGSGSQSQHPRLPASVSQSPGQRMAMKGQHTGSFRISQRPHAMRLLQKVLFILSFLFKHHEWRGRNVYL